MNLQEVLIKHGYEFRQHIEEEGYGWRKRNVIDLDMVQCEALKYGGVAGLKKAVAEQLYRPPWGLFTFPSFDIEGPLPRRPDLLLSRNGHPSAVVIAPRKEANLWAMAGEWVAGLGARHGLVLSLLDECDATPELLETQHLILFGGAHQNKLALALALRYRTFFMDSSVPGDDGWMVTTHCGLHASGNTIVQLAAPAVCRSAVLQLLFERIDVAGDDVILRHIHRVGMGAVMSAHFPSWESFTASLPERLPQFQGQAVEIPREIKALSSLLALGLDSGGREKNYYNVMPVDIAIDCARYYQLSADRRALELFRELLFRLVDYYLKTPGGASYPADLDFRLGLLILHYARLEHDAIFDDEDRLILTNLLLSCTRSIHEYAVKFWPIDPRDHSRHNHPTFKAISLLYAASYFSRFTLPCVQDWRAYTESVFTCKLWKRSKQRENSRSYEPFVFDHAALYALFTGRGLELFDEGCFEKMTERQIIATDNFFRQVDYGDTAIDMNPVDSLSAKLLATRMGGLIHWFAGEGFARMSSYLPHSFLDFPGLRMKQVEAPPLSGDWEYMPLDPAFLKEVAPGFPRHVAFDKLAFRTGWDSEDQYVLIEGVGGEVGHSHHEGNGIVRLNHLGRHWFVSNGYGKRVGITHAGKSFNSRELGPVDHNMLVLQRAGEIVRTLPMGALLQKGRKGPLLYATSALQGYGGVNWFRTILILSGRYVLVIDRIHILEAGLEKAHVEWNGLGQVSALKNGFRLDQKGIFMDVTSASGWRAEQTMADQSACWKRVLEDGSYPYATFPLAKLVFHLPGVGAGQTHCLGTLLAATKAETQYVISQPEPGRIQVEGPHGLERSIKFKNRDLEVQCDRHSCDLRFDPNPMGLL